jgi:hypothetical protein
LSAAPTALEATESGKEAGSCVSNSPQKRHPERSASQIHRVTQRSMARSRRACPERSRGNPAVLILQLPLGALQPPNPALADSPQSLPGAFGGRKALNGMCQQASSGFPRLRSGQALRRRAINPLLSNRSAMRFAQDDGFCGSFDKKHPQELAFMGLRPGMVGSNEGAAARPGGPAAKRQPSPGGLGIKSPR